MKIKYSNRTCAKIVVDFFHQRGMKHACIAPGSRNTPLTEAFINHGKIKCFSHIDERSLCYYALGLSKASSTMVAVLTTSGTATANLFPGIVEAKLSRIPLLILTADRPTSLINTGAPQTMEQKNLYGEYVNEMLDIDHKKLSLGKLMTKISKIIDDSVTNSEPVHINFRFDEPIFDTLDNITVPKPKPFKKISLKSEKLILSKFKRPLIICGPMSPKTPVKHISSFAKRLNAPMFVDILSQMRHMKNNGNLFVYHENYLHLIDKKPDIIFRFGDKPISKSLNIFLDKNKSKIFLIGESNTTNDDCQKKIKIRLKDIHSHVRSDYSGENSWIKHLGLMEKNASKIVHKTVKGNNYATLIRNVLQRTKKDDHVFIGNSTMIRIFDRFSGYFNSPLKVYGNHITRGIDGLISTALGISTFNKKGTNYIFTGDISFFYDMNGFHILKNEKINLTVIVVNNQGGQIFSQLPYADKKIKQFEKYWITPPFTKIKDVASLFKLKYYKYSMDEIKKNIKRISKLSDVKVVEVVINHKNDIKLLNTMNSKMNN